MANVAVPLWMFWTELVLLVLFLGAIAYCVYLIFKQKNSDTVIFIDKNNRWHQVFVSLKGRSSVTYKGDEYPLASDGGILNFRGKVMYIFAEGRASPVMIRYDKTEWLDVKSLMAMVNNKLVQKIVQPPDSFKDQLLLFGAIGGLIAGLSSVVILLLQLGVIGGGSS